MQKLKLRGSRRFVNNIDKVKAILGVFNGNEKLSGDEIARRLQKSGYRINTAHLRMFIHYNMLYKYLKKEVINKKIHYSLIN